MKRGIAALVFALAVTVTPLAHALRPPPDGARQNVRSILGEGHYGFCTKSARPPMSGHHGPMTCTFAQELDHCEELASACKATTPDEPSPFLEWLRKLLAPIAESLVWILVGALLIAILIPVLRMFLRARRDRRIADKTTSPSVAVVLAPPVSDPLAITDAEVALRAADAHASRGENDRAIALYLAASLAALGHRGAVRLARHRTNGEYVRFSTETTTRQPLREIVREVDRVEYGKIPPTPETVGAVASRAKSVVRMIALGALVIVLLGCGALRGGGPNDPTGDDLPMDVLRRSGFTVARLPSSLATMPIPTETATPPIVIVDTDKVHLEKDSEAHLMRWIDGGGVLVMFGHPSTWPKELAVKTTDVSIRELVVDHEGVRVDDARIALPSAIEWPNAEPIARLGDRAYAALQHRGRGHVIGVAGSDLFTNIGIAHPGNAAATVAILGIASESFEGDAPSVIHVARQEDGIPPPSNPFAAIVQAGLGTGAWHALAACIVLFLAFGIRHARAKPNPEPARRMFAEHVEAVGAFYGRTRATTHALAAYGRFAETRLRERLPRGADPAAFLAARSGVDPAHAAKVYARATAPADPADRPKGDELATIKELRAMLAKALT